MKLLINKIKKEFSSYNQILKDEFKKTFPIYSLGILFNGIQAIFHFWIPFIIGQILDLLLQGNIDKNAIINKVYLLIIVSIISIIPRIIYRTLFFTVARISDTKLRKKAIEHLQYVKPEYYEKEDKGTFLEYVSKELVAIREFLGNFFFELGKLVFNPAVVLIVIAIKYNIYIPAIVLPILITITLYIFRLYKDLEKEFEDGRIADIELFKTVEQNTSGFSLIKLYNQQKNQIDKFDKVNQLRYEADYKIGVVKNKISNGVNIMYATCYCITFGLGVLLIKNNILTIGGLTAIITCLSFIISEITSSIENIINSVAYFKRSTKRYNYFFALDLYKKDGKSLDDVQTIKLENLSYSYDGNTNVLSDIKIHIKKGEKIGIIGKVGSGKTTLMNIIAGFLETKQNQVFINNIDINEFSRDEIFKNVSYSTQKNIILDDSIENNINLTKSDKVNIEKLSELSDLHSDISQMDNEYKTLIGEQGNRLSGGQKQRVQIARTLSDIRSINIYDDTLSALDYETEEKVLNSIINETKEKILIIVSNKVSSMKNLDKVYMLLDGRIYAQGTHEELLEQNELYKEMYNYEEEGDLI